MILFQMEKDMVILSVFTEDILLYLLEDITQIQVLYFYIEDQEQHGQK